MKARSRDRQLIGAGGVNLATGGRAGGTVRQRVFARAAVGRQKGNGHADPAGGRPGESLLIGDDVEVEILRRGRGA